MRIPSYTLRAAAVAVGLAVLPAMASAAPTLTRSWHMCTPGALRNCAAISLSTTDLGGGSTAVLVKLTNRQGSGAPNNAAYSALSAMRFWFAGSFAATAGLTSTSLSGGATGTPTAWRATTGNAAQANYRVLALLGSGFASAPATTPGTVGGCQTGAGVSPVMYTCGAGQAVVFSFTVGQSFSAHNASEAFFAGDVSDGQTVNSLSCNSNNVRNSSATVCLDVTIQDTSTIPEPMSIALLGTGLFGLGGIRVLRKKNTEV